MQLNKLVEARPAVLTSVVTEFCVGVDNLVAASHASSPTTLPPVRPSTFTPFSLDAPAPGSVASPAAADEEGATPNLVRDLLVHNHHDDLRAAYVKMIAGACDACSRVAPDLLPRLSAAVLALGQWTRTRMTTRVPDVASILHKLVASSPAACTAVVSDGGVRSVVEMIAGPGALAELDADAPSPGSAAADEGSAAGAEEAGTAADVVHDIMSRPVRPSFGVDPEFGDSAAPLLAAVRC